MIIIKNVITKPTKCTFSLNFNLRETETLKPLNPRMHASHSVNERRRLVVRVHVRALRYFKILPLNLPGDTEESNYVTFHCFVIHQC